MSILKLLFIALLIGLAACSMKEVRAPLAPDINPAPPDYEDLQAGYTLRIVRPLLKSGGTSPSLKSKQAAGTTVSLSASDLLGYQTICYSIAGKRGGRVQLKFASAELTKDGFASSIREPPLPFALPRKAEYIRLIYLQRLSQSDHNMAIVASTRMDDLNRLTMQVRKDPGACITTHYVSCSWVPPGVAVRPEQTDRH